MSDKAKNKGMIAMLLVTLMLIFGGYPAVYSSVAEAAGNGGQVEPKDMGAAKNEDENLLKLMLNMKVMEKDMEEVLLNDSNRARFFDPDINKGIIDEDLLTRLLLLQEGLRDEFDRSMAEAGDKVEEDVEVPEAEEQEPEEVAELDDEDLLKLALEMKVMEKKLGKYVEAGGDTTNWTVFNPAFNAGFIDRPFLDRMVCLRQSFLGAFNNPFAGFRPFCPIFPRPPFFRPPFFRPPFEEPPFVRPPFFRPPFEEPPFVRPPFFRPPFEQPPFFRPPFEGERELD